MYKNLEDFLAGKASLLFDQDGNPTPRYTRVAIVALLTEASHSNNDLKSIELTRVVGGMAMAFGITETESAELLEVGEFLLKEKGKLDDFIASINSAYSDDQKQRILGLVWRVIDADGVADKLEAAFAAHLRVKLGLTLEQAVRARQLSHSPEFAMPS